MRRLCFLFKVETIVRCNCLLIVQICTVSQPAETFTVCSPAIHQVSMQSHSPNYFTKHWFIAQASNYTCWQTTNHSLNNAVHRKTMDHIPSAAGLLHHLLFKLRHKNTIFALETAKWYLLLSNLQESSKQVQTCIIQDWKAKTRFLLHETSKRLFLHVTMNFRITS